MAARAFPAERNRRRAAGHGASERRTVDGYPLRIVREEALGESSVLRGAGIRPAAPVRLASITPLVQRPSGLVQRPSGDRPSVEVVPAPRPMAAPAAAPEEFVRITSRSYRVAELRRARRAQFARRRLAALATLVVTVGTLAALAVGAGALRSLGQQRLAVLPGSVPTAGGYFYRVQPGDTLWSVATRLVGDGDPRPVVAELQGELHGRTFEPGARILVP